MKFLKFLFFFSSLISLNAATTYGQFSSLFTQMPGTKSSIVKFDSIDVIKNLVVSPSKDKIIIKEDGVYFLIASGQVGALTDPANGYMDLWVVRNDRPVANSNARMSIRDASETGALITEVIVELKTGDTVSFGFSASNPNLGFIYSEPANEPAVVSFYVSIFKMESI